MIGTAQTFITRYEITACKKYNFQMEQLTRLKLTSECDPERQQYRMLREIPDHRKDNTALNVADGSY